MAKRIYGVYDDEEVLMQAIPILKAQGVKCVDVQSPFPIHGIEPLIGCSTNANFHYSIFVWHQRNFICLMDDLVHDDPRLADQYRGKAELHALYEPSGIHSCYIRAHRILCRAWNGIYLPAEKQDSSRSYSTNTTSKNYR